MSSPLLNQVEEQIGYSFYRPELLSLALTHCSSGEEHNERLEFLGDSVLNCIVGDLLYNHFPKAAEGDLSRMRAALVREDTLVELAQQFVLGKSLKLGPGELKSGGRQRHSILADTVEALVGAIYLDGGFAVVQRVLHSWYQQRVIDLIPGERQKDAKSLLQELLQGRRLPLPSYQVVEVRGAAHRREFTIHCQISGLAEPCIGTGFSRRRAEQRAAEQALQRLSLP